MGLFKPLYYIKNPNKVEKAISALSSVKSEETLLEIYRKAPLDEVSEAALRQIHDQKILKNMLGNTALRWRNSKDPLIAIEKIDDLSFLKSIVKEGVTNKELFDKRKEIVLCAFEKMPNPGFDEIRVLLPLLDENRAVKWVNNLKYPDDKYILLDIAKNKDLPGLIAETAASLIPASEEPAMAKQIALSGNDAASKLFIDCLKMPEDKDYIMNMLFHSSFKKQKAIGLIAQWTDSLHYPEDKSFLCDIMMDKRLPDSITEAAAKKIPASDEPQLVKEIVSTGQDGAARIFLDHMDCFRLPEDKDILLHMLECKGFRRIKAAEILAKDKTMQNYKICPYCGRSADNISYSYKGLYNDMYYYSWRCKCGHEYSAPEGYGDGFAVTIAEYVRDPDRFH